MAANNGHEPVSGEWQSVKAVFGLAAHQPNKELFQQDSELFILDEIRSPLYCPLLMHLYNPLYASSCNGFTLEREQVKEGVAVEKVKRRELKEFPGVPVDIVRLIFERAMEDTPTPVHLALVSRQIQQWVEPLIYCNLAFYTNTSFTLFYRTFRNRRYSPSKSTAFFARHVKSLHISTRVAPRMEQVFAIGIVLKSLRAVAGWDYSWGCFVLRFLTFNYKGNPNAAPRILGRMRTSNQAEKWSKRDKAERIRRDGTDVHSFDGWLREDGLCKEQGVVEEDSFLQAEEDKELGTDTFAYKDLRRLSVSAHALRIFHIDFTARAFRDITHLDIYYHRLYDWSTLAAMKNLTHLAIDFLKLSDLTLTDMKECMNGIMGYCQDLPWLKVLILVCVTSWNHDFDLLDDEDSIISPLNFLSEDWQKGGPLITTTFDEHRLHYFTQLSLGMYDPRVVLGLVNNCVQKSHLMWEYMVDFVWPKDSYDWDFTVPQGEHKESWEVAEKIIQRRSRERAERRGKIRTAGVDRSGDSGLVNGEFGFGEIVSRRWKEAQLL